VLAQREQISAIKYELELLQCKVASSRDLLVNDLDEPTNALSEEFVLKRIKPKKIARSFSESTPEILIEHCESETSDVEDNSNKQ